MIYDSNILASRREIDPVNGFLRVSMSNITKSQVRPYLGREIPDHEKFNLDPNKVYNVLCPKEELEKAAKTFNNLPLTREHIEVDVDDVPKEKIVGSLGDHATVDGKYLKNNLIIYDKKDIDLVLSGKKKELSCGYRYTPIRESGEFDGQHYDFKMTDIVGNHVALVKQGRAGRDVMVADSSKGLLESIKEKILAVFDNDLVVDAEGKDEEEVVEDKDDTKKQEKVGVVMKEFKEGELKSGSGEKVTNPKQAIAIALSEADKVAKDEIPEKTGKPKKAGEESALQQGEKKMAEEVKEAKAEEKVEEAKEEKVVQDTCDKAEGKKEEKPVCDKDVDKRKLIDEIGGMLKGKVEEELLRIIIKKAETIAYNDSEATANDEEKKDDLKGKEKEAFAEGVDFGEKKEKEEPKKLDSEHESEGAKKADKEEKEKKEEMAKDSALVMDADALRAEGREQAVADFKCRDAARKAVRSIVGDVDVFAFDSADEIYKFACKEAGMNLDEIANFKDAFAGLQAGKGKLAMDASPVSGSDVECFKDIRLA